MISTKFGLSPWPSSVNTEVAMALDRCRKHGVRVVKAPGWKVQKVAVECCRGHRDSLRYEVVIRWWFWVKICQKCHENWWWWSEREKTQIKIKTLTPQKWVIDIYIYTYIYIAWCSKIFYDSRMWQFLEVLLYFTGKALGTTFGPAILVQVSHEEYWGILIVFGRPNFDSYSYIPHIFFLRFSKITRVHQVSLFLSGLTMVNRCQSS